MFGHAHQPWVREHGCVLLVTCGSVGKPKEGDPRAAFGVPHPQAEALKQRSSAPSTTPPRWLGRSPPHTSRTSKRRKPVNPPDLQARESRHDGRRLQLNDPQTLYRRWEDSQWSPFAIDLATDQQQWPALGGGAARAVHFVLSSLMVAEERITTKFSGLVGAHGSEEEATFLATQQVDEARHMQFYARFQDEVVAAPAEIAAHVAARARARLRRLPPDLRRRARRGARAARRRAGRPRREGPLRHALPPGPRGHARPDVLQVHHRLPRTTTGCCPGSSRATRRSTTTRPATSATASGSCARPSASTPSRPTSSAQTLRDLLPTSPTR